MTVRPISPPEPPEPPPIVQYWHREAIPDYVEAMLATFRERNPDFRHLVFSEPAAERFIGERFGARELAAFRSCAVPAMQADYFRYCAVLALGGVYVDVDERCIAGLRPLLPVAGRGRLFLRPPGAVINGLFAFGAPGHPFLELALEIATTNIERRHCDQVYFTTGPPIFTYLYYLYRLGSVEAACERVAGSGFEKHFRVYAQTVEDPIRLSLAFEGVTVSPMEESRAFIGTPGIPFPYKQTAGHWTNAGPEIFRELPSGKP